MKLGEIVVHMGTTTSPSFIKIGMKTKKFFNSPLLSYWYDTTKIDTLVNTSSTALMTTTYFTKQVVKNKKRLYTQFQSHRWSNNGLLTEVAGGSRPVLAPQKMKLLHLIGWKIHKQNFSSPKVFHFLRCQNGPALSCKQPLLNQQMIIALSSAYVCLMVLNAIHIHSSKLLKKYILIFFDHLGLIY